MIPSKNGLIGLRIWLRSSQTDFNVCSELMGSFYLCSFGIAVVLNLDWIWKIFEESQIFANFFYPRYVRYFTSTLWRATDNQDFSGWEKGYFHWWQTPVRSWLGLRNIKYHLDTLHSALGWLVLLIMIIIPEKRTIQQNWKSRHYHCCSCQLLLDGWEGLLSWRRIGLYWLWQLFGAWDLWLTCGV